MDQEKDLSTEVTEEDIKNGIEDEYGVVYSKDGKRLLKHKTNQLQSYTIKDGTRIVCDKAFFECNNLEIIQLPNSITRIGDNAFDNCYKLQIINIPNSVTYIGNSVFVECRGLRQITIPSSVTMVGNWCFSYCVNLRNLSIPNSIKTIGEGVFSNCESLRQVTIPNSVTTIGDGAFASCVSLRQVNIPNTVTTIGSVAFYNCVSLRQVNIPNNVTIIGDEAFSNCKKLRQITIPNSVSTIGNKLFADCSSLQQISIPTSVTSILDFAFIDCKSLNKIEIPNTVTFIGRNPFIGCSKVTLGCNSSCYVVNNGLLLEQGSNVISCVNQNSHIVIPNTVSKIADCAFANLTKMTHIVIPDSVESIGDHSFAYCTKLSKISIPYSVKVINDYAFYHCSKLKKITIPNSIDTIAEGEFSECCNLEQIDIPNSVTQIGDFAFFCCKSVTQLMIPNSITLIGDYSFWGCEAIKQIDMPKGVNSIGDGAFGFCTSLRTLTIDDSVKTIGNYAFYNNKYIQSTTIPYKFRNVVRIKKIIINHFRAYNNVTIEFDDFNCIIGKNDSGKSTIFAALEWFFDANKVLSENDFAASAFDTSKNKEDMYNDLTISVEVYFSGVILPNSSERYDFIYEKDFLDKENLLCIKKYMNHPRSLYQRNRMGYYIKTFPLIRNRESTFTKRYNKLDGAKELAKIYNNYYKDELPSQITEFEDYDERDVIIQYNLIQKNNIKSEICNKLYELLKSEKDKPKWEEFNNEQSDSFPFYLDWFDYYQFQIFKANTPISIYLNRLITPYNSDSLYKSIENTKGQITNDLFNILKDNNIIENIGFDRYESVNLFSENSTFFKIIDLPIWIPLSNRGEGLQLMIKHAVIKLLAEKQLENRNAIFAFEEPETHLHPTAQREMYQTIKKLSENPNYQVLMTTHSPYMVKELAKDNIKPIIIKRDEDNHKSEKVKESQERVLPYVSMNEINYIAFEYASEEYHQELFAQIEMNWAGHSDGNRLSSLIGNVFGKNNLESNLVIKKLIDDFNNDKNKIINIKYNTNEFISADQSNENYYIPSCVRNSIDHPCDDNKKWKESKVIALSIEILREINETIKKAQHYFKEQVKSKNNLDSYGETFSCTNCCDTNNHSIVYWVDYAMKHPTEKIVKNGGGKEIERKITNNSFLIKALQALDPNWKQNI